MAYVVFARKCRPQVFEDIVGQEHVTTTLANAIGMDRVAHAFLFAGPRGVGKTSTARILAKALNCVEGPRAVPCGKCASCVDIAAGKSLDVIEVDGASNRGIDEIRNIRENVKLAAAAGRYKVYIIDEVHMLTDFAFNALLKTLEEPPPHVKFIFATTHPQDVLPTIVSRCQRFDFKNIGVKTIVQVLRSIAQTEKIAVTDDALYAVARGAEGSLRDAESVFDQLITFAADRSSAGGITQADVAAMLGSVQEEVLSRAVVALRARDGAALIALVEELAEQGRDLSLFIKGLIVSVRNLTVAAVSRDPAAVIDLAPERVAALVEEARQWSPDELLYVFYTLSHAYNQMAWTPYPRICCEMALLKLAQQGVPVALGEVIRKLEGLTVPAARGPAPVLGKETAAAPERYEADEPPPVQDMPAERALEAPPEAPATDTDISFDRIVKRWSTFLERLGEKKISLAMYLREGGQLVSYENGTVRVGFLPKHRFYRESIEKNGNIRIVTEFLKEFFGVPIQVAFFELTGPGAATAPSGADTPADVQPRVQTENPDITADEPVIDQAVSLFRGKIISKTTEG